MASDQPIGQIHCHGVRSKKKNGGRSALFNSLFNGLCAALQGDLWAKFCPVSLGQFSQQFQQALAVFAIHIGQELLILFGDLIADLQHPHPSQISQ